MIDRFILGEHIEIKNRAGLTGRVQGVKLDNRGETVYRVKFDDTGLLPSEMDYYEKELTEYPGIGFENPTLNYGSLDFGNYQTDDKVDKEKQCPKCKKDWTITISLHGEKWRDCESCGQKYEDLK